MKSIEAVKETLRVDLEKLKIVSTVVILLTGGLIGLLFKNAEAFIKVILFVAGLFAEIIFVVYLWKLSNSIKGLIDSMEEENA